MEIKEQEAEKTSLKGYIIGIVGCVIFLLFGLALIAVSVSQLGDSDNAGFIIILIFGIIWSGLFIFIIYVIIDNAKYKLSIDKKIAEKKEIYFESPYGTFWYLSAPDHGMYGYECEIDWNDSGEKEDTVYIETDTPEGKEAVLCFERFERFFLDKHSTDFNVKNIVAEYITSHPQLFFDKLYPVVGKATLIEDAKIYWLGFLRNGDTQYEMDMQHVDAENIKITIKKDGSCKIEYDDPSEGRHYEV